MNIKHQVDYLQTFFNSKNIRDISTKALMTAEEVDLIKLAIKNNKSDVTIRINDNYALLFRKGKVFIKDSI